MAKKSNIERERYINEQTRPKTFRKKWENYWYHYKGVTIAGAAAVVLLAFFINDTLFAVKPDLTVYLGCEYNVSYEVTDILETRLAEYIEDYNGDGNTVVSVVAVAMSTSENADPNTVMAAQTKLIGAFSTYDTMLFLFDDTTANYLSEDDGAVFLDLSQRYPQFEYDSPYRLKLSNFTLFDEPEQLEALKQCDLFFMMRSIDLLPENRRQKAMDTYTTQLDLLDALVENYSI